AREVDPPDRCRGGQAARGTSCVGAGPGAPAVALAEGDVVEPSGSPPRADPAGRRAVIFPIKHAYACIMSGPAAFGPRAETHSPKEGADDGEDLSRRSGEQAWPPGSGGAGVDGAPAGEGPDSR